MVDATGKSERRRDKPQAVVFDAFGTLIAFGNARVNPFRHFLPSTSRQPLARRPFLTRHATPEAFASELGLAHLLPTVQEELRAELAELSLFPEVAATLQLLRQLKIKTAVCSNLAMPYGEPVRRLLPQVEHFIFSYETGAAKPEPEIYRAVCDSLRMAPSNVLFVGDSLRCDVEGPRGYGMRSARIDRSAGRTLLDVLKEEMV